MINEEIYWAPEQAEECSEFYKPSDPRSTEYDKRLNMDWRKVKQSKGRSKKREYITAIEAIVANWNEGILCNDEWARELFEHHGDIFLGAIATAFKRTVEEVIADCYILREKMPWISPTQDFIKGHITERYIDRVWRALEKGRRF